MAYFLVTTLHGPEWDQSRSIREQRLWPEHAAFMDQLVEDGFVHLGGPLGDESKAVLVIEAAGEQEIRQRFETDPWVPARMLELGPIEPWQIWLDGRRPSGAAA